MTVTSTTNITRPSAWIRIEPVVSRRTYINIWTYYMLPIYYFIAVYVFDMFGCLFLNSVFKIRIYKLTSILFNIFPSLFVQLRLLSRRTK